MSIRHIRAGSVNGGANVLSIIFSMSNGYDMGITMIVIIISRYICISNVRLGGVYVSWKHREIILIIIILEKFFTEEETRSKIYTRKMFEKLV